jgi:thioredoxin reductase (NADPH)
MADARAAITTDEDAVAFPELSDEQIGVLRRFGLERAVGAGEILYRRQDASFALFVILEGRVAVVDDYGGAHERVMVESGPRHLVGEYNLFTEQASYMSVVAREATRLVEIKPGRLRELMAAEEALGDLILRALLRRRELLIGEHVGLRIIGSSYSADSRRLLEFTARNRIPHSWVDVERDAAAEALLRDFAVAPADTPLGA